MRVVCEEVQEGGWDFNVTYTRTCTHSYVPSLLLNNTTLVDVQHSGTPCGLASSSGPRGAPLHCWQDWLCREGLQSTPERRCMSPKQHWSRAEK